jgi:hypothetical protein
MTVRNLHLQKSSSLVVAHLVLLKSSTKLSFLLPINLALPLAHLAPLLIVVMRQTIGKWVKPARLWHLIFTLP